MRLQSVTSPVASWLTTIRVGSTQDSALGANGWSGVLIKRLRSCSISYATRTRELRDRISLASTCHRTRRRRLRSGVASWMSPTSVHSTASVEEAHICHEHRLVLDLLVSTGCDGAGGCFMTANGDGSGPAQTGEKQRLIRQQQVRSLHSESNFCGLGCDAEDIDLCLQAFSE